MLAAFIDESGLHAEARTFCLAGYLATSETWFELARAWRAALAEYGLTAFHMSEYENRRGAFTSLSNADRIGLMKDLVSIVNAAEVGGFGIGVVLADYAKWRDRLIAAKSLSKAWWQHPYLLAFQWFLVELGVVADENHLSGRIGITLDQSTEFESRLRETHRQFLTDPALARGRIGSLSFASRLDATELQTADLLVYEVRKFLDRRLFSPGATQRVSMERLKHRVQRVKYFDENALRLITQ